MLKNEKLVHRLTIREKLSLLISKDMYRSGDVSGYSFPTFELKTNPFEGANDIKSTNYPSQKALAMTWNKDLIEKTSYYIGTENSIFTKNPFFNIPCKLDINYISDDPFVLSSFGTSFLNGIEKSLSFSCVETGSSSNEIVKKEMLDLPLYHFLKNNKEDYILVESLDEMLTLEEKFNTKKTYFAKTNSAREAARFINQGVFLVFYEGDRERALDKLELCVNNGTKMYGQYKNGAIKKEDYLKSLDLGEIIDEEKLNILCDEYIELLLSIERKKKKSISESRYLDNNNELPFDYNKHNEVAYEAAKEGLVLLKNDRGILPLKSTTKVAVVGDAFSNLQYYKEMFGHNSSIFHAPVDEITDFLEINYVGYAHGYVKNKPNDAELHKNMVSLVNESDVVLFFMCADAYTGEIPSEQIEALISLHVECEKPIVLVLISDKYPDLSFKDKCDAIIYSPNLGQNLSKVILDVICGNENPSGRLVSNYPVLMAFENISDGYPMYTDKSFPKFYPFGYGLSYSNFEYKNLIIREDGVEFSITNLSDMDGYDVPQVYVYKEGSSSLSNRLLRGFEKVFVRAHETERVFIEFDEKTFAYYNTKKGCYGVEGGEYFIYIQSDSETVKLEGTLHLSKYLDQTYAYDTSTLSNEINNKSDFEEIVDKSLKFNAPLKLLVSCLIGIYLLGVIVLFWYLTIYSKLQTFNNIGTYIFAGVALIVVLIDLIYNIKNFKKAKKLHQEYLNSDVTLFEMINNVNEFEATQDIVFNLNEEAPLEEELKATDLVSEEVKAQIESEEKQEVFVEEDLAVEKEVKEEILEDISHTVLSDAEIAEHEREELEKIDSQGEESNSSFDEYEEVVNFDDSTSIQMIIDKFISYSESKGIIIEASCARSLFSSIASNKIIILNSKLRELLNPFLEILSSFLVSKSHINVASDEWNSSFNLVWKKNEDGTYQKTEFVNDLYNACRFKNSLNALFLTNVSMSNATRYLKEFIAFSSNTNGTHSLKLNSTQSIKIPNNVTLFIVPKEENYINLISPELSNVSNCVDLILRKNEMQEREFVEPIVVSQSYLDDLVYESKKINFLSEDNWKKIDNLEIEIGNVNERFKVSNKLTLSIERYSAIYLESGGDQLDCLDSILSEKIVPSLKKLNAFSADGGDAKLLSIFEKVFGEDNISKSKRIIKTSME